MTYKILLANHRKKIKYYVEVNFHLLCRVCFTGSGFIVGDLLGDLMQALELVSEEE